MSFFKSPNGQWSSARMFGAACLLAAMVSSAFGETVLVAQWLGASMAFAGTSLAQHHKSMKP